MNSKRQCDLFGHTAPYINTSLLRLAINVSAFIFREREDLWEKGYEDDDTKFTRKKR